MLVSVRSVSVLSDVVNLQSGLSSPSSFPWSSSFLTPDDALPLVRQRVPTSDPGIVEWMQAATAQAIVLDGWSEDNSKSQAEILSAVGDGYSPGVRMGSIFFQSQTYSRLSSGGAIFTTPLGDVRVPFGGGALVAGRDLLAAAAAEKRPLETAQWSGYFVIWRKLAKPPVKDRMRFPVMGSMTLPNFFAVSPRAPFPTSVIVMRITSPAESVMHASIRDMDDYGKVLAKGEFKVPAGQSRVEAVLQRFPYIGMYVLQLQPKSEKVVLDALDVYP